MSIINYKDFNVNNLSFDKRFNLVYRDNLFLLKTNYITINSNVNKDDKNYVIQFLINDHDTISSKIFIKVLQDINEKMKSIKKPEIIKFDNNYISISANLSISDSKIKTKFYYDNEYISDFNNYINPKSRCCLILFLNPSNPNLFEIIEMKINKPRIPKNEIKLPQYTSKYLEIDSELENIINIINS